MNDTRPTFLSLFAGIGGLDLGLERAGWRCVGQVEIDPFCRRVLAKHWPDVPRFEDVRAVTAGDFSEPIDLIAGGFPCQDISSAGHKAGIDGERSGLWSEFHRLICELRPSFALVENVPALLARGIDRVVGDLADDGYDAEWACIPASAVGAPIGREGRDRVWLVAYPNRGGREGQGVSRQPERPVLARPAGSGGPLTRLPGAASGHWASEPDVGRVVDGVSDGMDRRERIHALGNAVVPQVAEWIGRRILAACPTQITAHPTGFQLENPENNYLRILVPQFNPLTDKELDSGPAAAKTPAGAEPCAHPADSSCPPESPNVPNSSGRPSHPNPPHREGGAHA